MTTIMGDLDIFEQIVTDDELAPPCQRFESGCTASAEWWTKWHYHECWHDAPAVETYVSLFCATCKDLVTDRTATSPCQECHTWMKLAEYLVDLGEL